VRGLYFQRRPQPQVQGPSDADASEYWMPFAFLFLNLYVCFINVNYCAQMLSFGRIYNRSCSVAPTVPVQLYELGGTGTLFANNQRRRNAVPLRPKPLSPL